MYGSNGLKSTLNFKYDTTQVRGNMCLYYTLSRHYPSAKSATIIKEGKEYGRKSVSSVVCIL